MKNFLNNKNNLVKFMSCVVLTGFSLLIFANQNCNALTKLQEKKQKINKLKMLEKKEMNKLNKNQQKLENTEKELTFSRNPEDDIFKAFL